MPAAGNDAVLNDACEARGKGGGQGKVIVPREIDEALGIAPFVANEPVLKTMAPPM